MINAPIIIVDDDQDDNEILQQTWKELPYSNELVFFCNAEDAIAYLAKEKVVPFLILSDVNLPKMDGFEFKARLLQDESIRYASIPFIFWSTTATDTQIKKAYDLGGNGFFIKGRTFIEIKESLLEIVKYWIKSKTPLSKDR